MPRLLIAALLATAAFTGTAHAQYYGERPMPSYDDGEPRDPRGYYDSYGTADAREDEDSPVDEQSMAEYRQATHWVRPKPYAREAQVDEGTPNDAAHRADRAYTAELNRNAYNRSVRSSSAGAGSGNYARNSAQYRADLNQHAREMQEYRAARARYAERVSDWRARTNACEAGNYDACQ